MSKMKAKKISVSLLILTAVSFFLGGCNFQIQTEGLSLRDPSGSKEFLSDSKFVQMKRSFFIQEDGQCQLVEDLSSKLGATLKEFEDAGIPTTSIAFRREAPNAVARCFACGCGGLSGAFWVEIRDGYELKAGSLGFEMVWSAPEGDNLKVLMERQDGSIQCSRSNPSIAERFEKARQDLLKIQVSDDTLEWRQWGSLNTNAMCGESSGSVIRLRVAESDRTAVQALGFSPVVEVVQPRDD